MQLDSKYVGQCYCHMHTSDIWEERICMCVYIWHSNGNDWHTPYDDWTASRQKTEREGEGKRDDERTEEGGERDHVKKSSAFVCQSFYNDTVVIRIYIHYKASECMTWMYLHFNSERARNLFCTIDLMMWLYSKLVRLSFLDIGFSFYLSVLFSLLFLTQVITIHVEQDDEKREVL